MIRKAKTFTRRTPATENSMAQDMCGLASILFIIIALVGWLPEAARVMH